MARYSKNSPFFDKNMRILSASACFADIAVASGGIWNLSLLEDRLNWDRDGITGMYRKMPLGVVPKDETCELIKSRQKNTNLFYWRDLPLWILLSNHLIGTEQYNQLTEDAWDPEDEKYLLSNNTFLNHRGSIFQEYLWHGSENNTGSNLESLESLILYTARLRRSIDRDLLPLVCRYSSATRYILEKLLYKTPQLYIRWPLLIKIYRDVLWPKKISEHHLNQELNITLKVMADTNPMPFKYASLYPPKHLHRRLNHQYLKSIYDQ